MSDPPVRVDPDVPLPRRTALVPLVEDEDPPRLVELEPDVDEDELDPDDDDPLDDDPEEPEEPDEPLDGGADRTGCCSE